MKKIELGENIGVGWNYYLNLGLGRKYMLKIFV
jgi:hypothetical protein